MSCLITGAHGFVGAATMKYLDASWVTFDIMDGDDIRDETKLEKAIQRLGPNSRILHLAAIARFAEADADPMRCIEINVLGTRNVAMLAERYCVPLVYASTGSVYMPIEATPPITEEFKACGNSVYGCSKYAGELYVRRMRTPWIVLRYAHLYGNEKRHHGLVGGFLDRIAHDLQPTLYGGKQSNDFCYIKDVANANVLALNAPHDAWNQIYNIGTGEEITTQKAAEIICDVFGYRGQIAMREQRTVDPDRFFFDCSKAERMLGFKAAFGFRDGLEDMKGALT